MAAPIYLMMANKTHDGWFTLKACTTEPAAIRAAEVLMNAPVKTGVVKGWRLWDSGKDITPPRSFPGKFVKTWSANSVGGIGGNPWSYIAVAELAVEDDVLERLAEI